MYPKVPILCVMTAALGICLGLTGTANAQAKIGIVNVTDAFDKYSKAGEVNKQLRVLVVELQRKVNTKNRIVDDLQQGIGKLQEELLREDLNEDQRRKILDDLQFKQNSIEVTRREVQNEVQAGNNNINNFRNENRNKILKEVTDMIDTIGKAQKFDLIFDISGRSTTNVPALLFSSGNVTNLTEEVIKGLNAPK